MIHILVGIFIILHGLVHLLYVGLSRKLFELDPPLVGWPERSWVFSNFFADTTTRLIATVLYVLATAIFVIGGAAYLLKMPWWNPVLIGAVVISSLTVVLFWDGQLYRMPDKGFIGIVINIVLVAVLFYLERFAVPA